MLDVLRARRQDVAGDGAAGAVEVSVLDVLRARGREAAGREVGVDSAGGDGLHLLVGDGRVRVRVALGGDLERELEVHGRGGDARTRLVHGERQAEGVDARDEAGMEGGHEGLARRRQVDGDKDARGVEGLQ